MKCRSSISGGWPWQVSGPANRSQQSPGIYTVCYERNNGVTGVRDTCCFTVTLTCPGTPAATSFAMAVSPNDAGSKGLQVSAFPNPGLSLFNQNSTSGNPEKINHLGMDIAGKVVEAGSGQSPNQTIRIEAS